MRSAYSVSLSKCQPAPRQALAWLLALGCLIASPLASAEATIKVAGTGSATPLLETLGKAYERKTPRIRVEVVLPPMGSSAAQRAVMGGAIDLALSAKPLAQADQEKGGEHRELGRTPFILITRERRLDNVNSETLAEIFGGRISAWPDGTPIRLILRPPTESDTILLRGLSPSMDKAMAQALSRPGVPIATNDLENMALLEKTPGALGMGNLALLTGLNSSLHPVPLNGVAPTLANLERGLYPQAKSLFVIRGPGISDAARGFLEFMHSAEGRKIVAKQGYIPVKREP